MFLTLIVLLNLIYPRTWIIPKISHGEVKEAVSIKEYKKDSLEYKILQLALDIENLVRSNIDIKYKSVFLSILPDNNKLHENVLRRNKNYQNIEVLKKENKIKEGTTLNELKKLKKSEAEILNNENKDREELYTLIAEILLIDKEKQNIIKEVYFEALNNFKFYSLKETNSPTSSSDTSFLTYIISNYSYEDVLKVLKGDHKNKGLIEEQGFAIDTSKDLKLNILILLYACEKDEFMPNSKNKNRSFIIKLCPIKNNVVQMCDLKEDIFKTAVKNGTIIIINNTDEEANKDKTLFYSSAVNEDIEIMLCKKTPFKLLEDLSQSLLKIPSKKEAAKETKKND